MAEQIMVRVGFGSYANNHIPAKYPYCMEFDFDTLDDFKQEFLKRFGNIKGNNKAEKDRQKVKWITHSMTDFDDWSNLIESQTHWRVCVCYRDGWFL